MKRPTKNVPCYACNGRGYWQDTHPHNGSPCGDKEPCRTCKETGELKRPLTDTEMIDWMYSQLKTYGRLP